MYYPKDCIGVIVKACCPGARFPSDRQPCLHGLINGDPILQQLCPVVITTRILSTIPQASYDLNKYVLTTPTTRYVYRCPQGRPIAGELKNGSYIIKVHPHCILSRNVWTLHGLIVKERPPINQTAVKPSPLNLDWLDTKFPKLTLHKYIPPGVETLELPSYSALELLPDVDLQSALRGIALRGLPLWTIFLITLTLCLVTGIIIYIVYRGQPCILCSTCARCCRRCQRRQRPPTIVHQHQFEQVPSSTPPLDARTRAATFPRTASRPSISTTPEAIPMDILVPVSAMVPAEADVSAVTFDIPPEESGAVQHSQYVRLPWSWFNPEATPHPRHRYAVNRDAAVNTDGTLADDDDDDSIVSVSEPERVPEAESGV